MKKKEKKEKIKKKNRHCPKDFAVILGNQNDCIAFIMGSAEPLFLSNLFPASHDALFFFENRQ